MPRLTIIIPFRPGSRAEPTLRTLASQTWRDFDIVLSQDEKRNANWARNRGWEMADSELLLFSDDDIEWRPDALERLVSTLDAHPESSYSYGAYQMAGKLVCNQEWDAGLLRRQNFISTMTVIRAEHFPGFDETIPRLQDYDVWLTMLKAGHQGVYCGHVIFSTEYSADGITRGSGISYGEAINIIRQKHFS